MSFCFYYSVKQVVLHQMGNAQWEKELVVYIGGQQERRVGLSKTLRSLSAYVDH